LSRFRKSAFHRGGTISISGNFRGVCGGLSSVGQACFGLLLFSVVIIVPQMHRTYPKWHDLHDILSRRTK